MVLLAPCLLLQALELNTIGVQPHLVLQKNVADGERTFISNFQGEPNWRRPPKNIAGHLLSKQGNVTAQVVLAENYQAEISSNKNKYCREPFAKGTFNGEIVICQQSDNSVNAIAENLKQAGAAGMIIQATSLENIESNTVEAIPSISLNLDAYFLLKNWVKFSEPGTAIATIGD